MNRTLLQSFLSLALALFLNFDAVSADGVRGAAAASATLTGQQTLIISNGNGGDGNSTRGNNYINSGAKDHILNNNSKQINSSRTLYNKISSTHHIQLEYSGVSYASVSLDIVKADIVDEVRDTLSKYLGNDIEVVAVKKVYRRKLRGQSRRKLSYIRLVVTISLRHASWISTERASATTIVTLRDHVDEDFRRYIRNLPGNGDYVGEVDVSNYYSDVAIGVSTTDIPIITPTQVSNGQTTIGSFPFKLIFTEVSTNLAISDILRNYILYGITRILKANLDYGIELLDVSLEPWLPEVWLTFTILISLQYPRLQKDAFAYADDVLRRNTGDLDLYLDDYLATYSLSEVEKAELESTMKEVFGEMAGVEIGKQTAAPTSSPTKSVKPVNDWVNTSADTLETIMPWWGWVILGIALAFITVCCCYFSMRYMRHKCTSEPATVTNNIQVVEPVKPELFIAAKPEPIVLKAEPIVIKHVTGHRLPARERIPVSKSMNVYGNINSVPKNVIDERRLAQSLTLDSRQIPAHHILTNIDPRLDAVPYEPNPNAPDPKERIREPKKKQKKRKKKGKKEKTLGPSTGVAAYEPNSHAPDPEERILAIEPKKSKKKKKKKKKVKELGPNAHAPDPDERKLAIEPAKRKNKKIQDPCTDVALFDPNPNAPDPDEKIFSNPCDTPWV